MSHQYQPLQNSKGIIKFSVFEILAVLYIAHKLLPVMGYYTPGVVFLGLFGLTFVLLLPLFRLKAAWAILGMFAVSSLTLISKLLSMDGSGAFYLYGELQVYLYGIITLRAITGDNVKFCRRLLVMILIMYMITAVTTYIGTINYPGAARMMATLSNTDLLYHTYVKKNIGNFTFVYELLLLLPLLIYLTKSKWLQPVLGYLLIALTGVVIVATEYGMAVLLYCVSLLLLVPRKLTTKRLMIILMVVLVVFVVGADSIAVLFERLSDSVDSETLSERFLVVAETLKGEDKLSSATGMARIELYTKSLKGFRDTAFLGKWDIGSVGGHSFVFDTLGCYGLLGIVGMIIVFFTIYKLCLKPYQQEDFFPYMLCTCLLGVALMVLNPKIYPFIFLCVLPLFGTTLKSRERSETA